MGGWLSEVAGHITLEDLGKSGRVWREASEPRTL